VFSQLIFAESSGNFETNLKFLTTILNMTIRFSLLILKFIAGLLFLLCIYQLVQLNFLI